MQPDVGAIPLVALDAVAFDTETTGLDTARLVQVGGVAIARGAVCRDRSFESLIDPGASVPPESTRIHGITDAMVREAPAFAYRAIGRMDRLGIRHLGVHDEKEALIGVISARDLLRLRASAAIQLDDMINAARSDAEMAAAWASLPSVASALVAEKIEARTVAEIVSEELRAMTRRAAILAEEEMKIVGLGDPPSPYAVLVLGSAGGGESLLAADQDNAIVFKRGVPGGPEDRWFSALGGRIAAILDTDGIAYCKGGVMAKNAEWRGSLDLWRERISQWVRRSRPQDLLNIDIFFDLAPVHGARGLGETLFEDAYAYGHADAAFPLVLGERLASLPTPFTLFGGLRTEEGRIDLKRYRPFPSCLCRASAVDPPQYSRALHGCAARRSPGAADRQ